MFAVIVLFVIFYDMMGIVVSTFKIHKEDERHASSNAITSLSKNRN